MSGTCRGWLGRIAGRRLGAAVMLSLLLPLLAAGHARLLRSTPADKAELERAPERIELVFNELLDDSFNTVAVYRAAEYRQKQRRNLVKGKPQVDPQQRTRLIVELQPLTPGEYFVDYRVLSRDGHTAPGRLSFTVRGTAR